MLEGMQQWLLLQVMFAWPKNTFMTLLNMVSNLGGNWPTTEPLWLVEPLTIKESIAALGHSCGTSAAIEGSFGVHKTLSIPV